MLTEGRGEYNKNLLRIPSCLAGESEPENNYGDSRNRFGDRIDSKSLILENGNSPKFSVQLVQRFS